MWYYALNGQRLGPVDEAAMRALLANGTVNIDTLVWTQGMTNWVKLGQSTLAAGLSLPPAVPGQTYAAPMAGSFGPDRKDRAAYILLAVLLGFGVHNFYAGYKSRGLTQLLCTFLSCGFLWFPMWVWAIVEACTVEVDAAGVRFK